MNIYKKSGKIYLTSMKFEELITLLKIQVNCELIFSDIESKVMEAGKTITIGLRGLKGRTQVINYSIASLEYETTYNKLLEQISDFCSTGRLTFSVLIDQNDFRLQENLIRLIPDINIEVIQNCVFLKFDDEVYTVMYKPFDNKDSNLLYFFESNNTLLAFTENGPELLTDNPKISNITDIIC